MKNILVTGGLGFIGSHTVVELIGAGMHPVILDNLNNSERRVLQGLKAITGELPTFYEGDFQDQKLATKIIAKERIDGVIHFAAFKDVNESLQNPLDYYQNNVSGLVTFLQTLTENNVNNFVFSSSCTVYGEAKTIPVNEEEPIKPAVSPYGTTKQFDETIIKDTASAHNFRAVSLRYFNPVGAHPSAKIGELPKGVPANLIPLITQAAAGLRPKLTVYGNDYPTKDGSCVRDFIHVMDLARAHVKALEHISKQKDHYYDVINIGTGKGTSVLEAIKTFEKVTRARVPYVIGPRRPGDIIISYADVSKAQRVLGWRAEKSLADALTDAWRWQQAISGASD